VIRLERVRDNPSNFAIAAGCGVTAAIVPPNPSDYWPNALYDTREGYNRQPQPALKNQVTLGGIMNYIELDVKNLAAWFNGTLQLLQFRPQHLDKLAAPNNFVSISPTAAATISPQGRQSAPGLPSRPPRTRPANMVTLTWSIRQTPRAARITRSSPPR